jgi:uncharacterized protein (UPF0548 family)
MTVEKWNGMTVEKHRDGWIVIYGTIKGHLVQERYLYYTIKQAKKLFNEKYSS